MKEDEFRAEGVLLSIINSHYSPLPHLQRHLIAPSLVALMLLLARAVVAEDLAPVDPANLPLAGSFYLLSTCPAGARILAPVPFCPEEGIVYQVTQYPNREDIFLVDQRSLPQIDTVLLSSLETIRASIEATEMRFAMNAAANSTMMGAGLGLNELDSGGGEGLKDYSSSELWLEITSATNSVGNMTACFIVHPPEGELDFWPYKRFEGHLSAVTGVLRARNRAQKSR